MEVEHYEIQTHLISSKAINASNFVVHCRGITFGQETSQQEAKTSSTHLSKWAQKTEKVWLDTKNIP